MTDQVERLRGLLAGHEVEVALAITRAIGGNPHDAGLRIVNALPLLLDVAEAAADLLDWPRTSEVSPADSEYPALRAALSALAADPDRG